MYVELEERISKLENTLVEKDDEIKDVCLSMVAILLELKKIYVILKEEKPSDDDLIEECEEDCDDPDCQFCGGESFFN